MGYLLKKNRVPLLGQLLLKGREVTPEQLLIGLANQADNGGFIGVILKDLGYINDKTLLKYLAIQAKLVARSHKKAKAFQ